MKKILMLMLLSFLSLNSCNLIDTSSSNNDSSSSDEDINISVEKVDKEAYKAMVDRSKINYSEDFINDPTVDVNELEVWQINDTHGAYYEGEDLTGISKVATCIKENTNNPYGVVKIGNGDLLQGTAFSNLLLGEPGIAALNEMDFDAFVIGNHEFDWGFDNLKVYKDGDLSNGELDCPFLGANILDGNNQRPDWIEPYTVVQKGNVKVGILGLIGNGLESSISKIALGDYHFSDTVEAVNKYSKILLEDEKVNILIISEHSHNEVINQTYANNVEVDLIINGHDHQYIEEYVSRYDGKMVPVIESNTKNISIGKVTLVLDENKDMETYSMQHYKPALYTEDASLKSIMDVYNEVTEIYENEVIGYNKGGFDKKTIGISTCTYVAKKYDADVVVINTGGVRANIKEDTITNGLVYEVFPFDNELYLATVTGSQLKSLVNGSGYYFNNSGFAKGTFVDASSINSNDEYKIVVVDYVATNHYKFQQIFSNPDNYETTGDYIRDCAIENIKVNYKKI